MVKNRSARRKKRRFFGNQHNNSEAVPKTNVNTGSVSNIATASTFKLKDFDFDKFSNHVSNPVDDYEETGFRLFDCSILKEVFEDLACPECTNSGLILKECRQEGLCSAFTINCKSCDYQRSFCSSRKNGKCSEANIRLTYAMRQLGHGHSGAKKLCTFLNCPPPVQPNSYNQIQVKIGKAVNKVSLDSMLQATEDIKLLKMDTSAVVPCGVSVDGTWQRRGYSSLNGTVSIISIDTGKVLDIETLSSYCQTCKTKNNKGVHKCTKNYDGSSASMEPVGAYRMFERSIEKRGLAYVDFYGDGDSKSYESVKDVYEDFQVKKYECIGHVQKRVGARLRNLKKRVKGLGGKNKLTDHFIDKLQNYYGIAIRQSAGDLEKMQKNTIAALFHCASSKTNILPHNQCPIGASSWCKYQRSLVDKNVKYKPGPGLPSDVLKHVRPVYTDLCDRKLLEKCLHGRTQNNNESFNGMVWQRLPKTTFVRLNTLTFGVNDTVIVFNEGYCKGLSSVFTSLGLPIGKYTEKGFQKLDTLRIKKSKIAGTPCIKTRRKIIRSAKKQKLDYYEQVEGVTYKCGEF